MKSTFFAHQFYIFGIRVILTYGCGQSEYQSAKGDCCPMCNIGMVVLRDCFGDYSTTCKPCSSGTFMGHPNGLKQCFQCKSCDSQQGLYVLSPCTTIRDTQCEVLDGYYCTEYKGSECRSAMRHRQCDPGESIKTPGNKESDTVCEVCPLGFYSLLGINCTRWSDCSAKNELQDREGSAVEDVQCSAKQDRQRRWLIIPTVLALSPIMMLTVLYVKHICLTDKTSSRENHGDQLNVGFRIPVPETGHSTVQT